MKQVATLMTLAALAASCAPFAPSTKEDLRNVRITVVPPSSQDSALGGTRPIQLAALRIELGQLMEVRTSPSADPRTTQSLSLGLPRSGSWVLVLQAPRSGARLGQLVARVLWDAPDLTRSSRIPEGKISFALGDVEFDTGSPDTLADNVVNVAAERSPRKTTDLDNDGFADLEDPDMDNDSVTNVMDDDADGDGLMDQGQELASLADSNGFEDGDGIPDDLE